MPSITFKKSVAKDLRKLSKEIRKRIFSKIEEDLSDHPLDYPELNGKFAGLRKSGLVITGDLAGRPGACHPPPIANRLTTDSFA